VIAAEDTAWDMSAERISKGSRVRYLLPGVGDIGLSSSGGISTTLSPTKRKRRRKRVKITKKKEDANLGKIPDKIISIPT
jgi:hypothetical protein